MIREEPIRVLLVEDDEDDFILTRCHFDELPEGRYMLDWARTYEEAEARLAENCHDACLVDYRLGARDGIELLRTTRVNGCEIPMILLTGAGALAVDIKAMEAGADDYLVKSDLSAAVLERSIRYSIQRKRVAAAVAAEQARLAALGADVGLAVSQRDSLDAILERCTSAMNRYLNVELAQIWIPIAEKRCQLRVTTGETEWCDRTQTAPPLLKLDTEKLAAGETIVVENPAEDPRLRDRAVAAELGVKSLLAYPLLLEGRLVGVVVLAATSPLGVQAARDLSSIANGIALCIERKRSEEALSDSEVKYRKVVDSVKDVIFQLDEFGHWSFLNSAWTAVTGFPVSQTLGTYLMEYLHEEDRERCRHIYLALMNRKLDYCRFEARFYTASGKTCWAELFIQPAIAKDGSITGATGNLTDVTFRRQAEMQIQRLAAFPKVNPNPVLEFGADGHISYANEAAQCLVETLAKTDILDILPPNVESTVRQCMRSGQSLLQQEVNLDDRKITWSFFPIAGHRVVHCYGEDVTEMQNLEAQFRHAQKLESVGQLAAGVAHDFNNILTVILGYADSLLEDHREDDELERPLRQISEAAKRAAALTRQLLLFSRKQLIRTRVLDLNGLLSNLNNMLARLLGEDIALQSEWADSLPTIEGDAGMIEQVVMNLAVNARDAMPHGGSLRIQTETVSLTQDDARKHAEGRAGDFVRLKVADSGSGMDEATLSRIFEPFFSTKEFGKGTGLGLATVYGIVKQHKGWVEVTSKVGVGTTFEILLPVAAVKDSQGATGPKEQRLPKGENETILLVEDEDEVRDLIREILETLSYKVVVAQSGAEALQVWEENDGRFDLLLTDVVMPGGMNGHELATQFRLRNPRLKVILSSGYNPDKIGGLSGSGNTEFLPKPYPPQELARLVQKCLEGARARELVSVA